MLVETSCGRVRVEAIAHTADEAYIHARARRRVMVVVPGAVWLCSERVAERLQRAGYEVL